MTAQGQAAISLDEFDKSEQMAEIRSMIQEVANTGARMVFIVYEKLGTSREAIYTATLLGIHGYEVQYYPEGISVKL